MGTAMPNGQHVLYRHWGKDGTLLYAGMTNNPPARLRKHRAEADWWADVAWTTYERFSTREALKIAETQAIQDENPSCNINERQYRTVTRESPEPGFDRYTPVTSRDLGPDIRLVHPLSRKFSVYGGNDTLRRAREWALRNRYYLLDSGPVCAHAFYLMRCPNVGKRCLPHADHTQVWVPAPDFSDFEHRSGAAAPFILTQPYYDALPDTGDDDDAGIPEGSGLAALAPEYGIPAAIMVYAAAHGITAESWRRDDAWYYPEHCMPIRLTADGRGMTAFPLETETLSLMCAWRRFFATAAQTRV